MKSKTNQFVFTWSDYILIRQKTLSLADFGLSEKIAEALSNTSKILGIIDPKTFDNRMVHKDLYRGNKIMNLIIIVIN